MRGYKLYLLVLGAALAMVMAACSDSTNPDPGVPSGPAGYGISVPGDVISGEPFTVTITALNAAGERITDHAGSVTLRSTALPLAEQTVDLVDGVGTTQVTFAGLGSTSLMVSGNGVTSTSQVFGVFSNKLDGADSDPAIAPDLPAQPREQDFSEDHPELGGSVSFNTILLIPADGSRVGEVNDLLDELGALIVGGVAGSGSQPGLLVLRLPTTTHVDLDAVIEQLDGDARVAVVVRDSEVEGGSIPRPSTNPNDWTWSTTPGGGNWGLERIRVPQMWNLFPALKKANTAAVRTAVIDCGFETNHPDGELTYAVNLGPPNQEHDHGTHVVGTIAAEFDNGKGVDGVNPFSSLVVHAPSYTNTCGFAFSWVLTAVGSIVKNQNVKVINMSIGRNWDELNPPRNPSASLRDRLKLYHKGYVFSKVLESLALTRPLPLFVVSAGNSSGGTIGRVEARYNTGYANAGLDHDVEAVLVVESVMNAPNNGTEGKAARSGFSNIMGHVSAPGTGIRSTMASSAYGIKNGTSMASPHVTGVVGFLYAIDPNLTHAQIRDLLTRNARAVADEASKCIDAFASAVDIDRIRGNDRVLKMLVDIDDGSDDGNLREEYLTAATNTDEDVDSDNGPGDGKVDMSDFRRWRDWYLQANNIADTDLDGAANHPKKDLNGDRELDGTPPETVYPRGDFNGDGKIGLDPAFYPGRIQAEVTDLQVLARLWDDDHYDTAQLPGLVESWDLVVDGTDMLVLENTARVDVEVRTIPVGVSADTRELTANDPTQILTVPHASQGYNLVARSYAADGTVLATVEKHVTPKKGEDVVWQPEPQAQLLVSITAPSVVEDTDTFPVVVRVARRGADGVVTYPPGTSVNLSMTGGSITPANSLTDTDGALSAEGMMFETTELATIFVEATRAGAVDGFATAEVRRGVVKATITEFGIWDQQVGAAAVANDQEVNNSYDFKRCTDPPGDPNFTSLDPNVSHDFDWSCGESFSEGRVNATASASGSLDLELGLDPSGQYLQRVNWKGTAFVSGSTGGGCTVNESPAASSSANASVYYRVVLNFTLQDQASFVVKGRIQGVAHVIFGGGQNNQSFIWSGNDAVDFDETVELAPGDYQFNIYCRENDEARCPSTGDFNQSFSNTGDYDMSFEFQ